MPLSNASAPAPRQPLGKEPSLDQEGMCSEAVPLLVKRGLRTVPCTTHSRETMLAEWREAVLDPCEEPGETALQKVTWHCS